LFGQKFKGLAGLIQRPIPKIQKLRISQTIPITLNNIRNMQCQNTTSRTSCVLKINIQSVTGANQNNKLLLVLGFV